MGCWVNITGLLGSKLLDVQVNCRVKFTLPKAHSGYIPTDVSRYT